MNILTNAQLEDIVRLMPRSIADFRKVSGIGEAKSKNYGEELLVLILTRYVLFNEDRSLSGLSATQCITSCSVHVLRHGYAISRSRAGAA